MDSNLGSKKRIAVIPGDGIGQEVIPQAVKVMEATGASVELSEFDWSADRYLADGVTVPQDGFAMLGRDFDAILIGAVGDPRVPNNIHGKEILLGMHQDEAAKKILQQTDNTTKFDLLPGGEETVRRKLVELYRPRGGR